MNAVTSETKKLEIWNLACRFLSFSRSASWFRQCAPPPKNEAPTILMLEWTFLLKFNVPINTYRLTQKNCHAHFNAHKLVQIVNINADISETVKDRELGFQI